MFLERQSSGQYRQSSSVLVVQLCSTIPLKFHSLLEIQVEFDKVVAWLQKVFIEAVLRLRYRGGPNHRAQWEISEVRSYP